MRTSFPLAHFSDTHLGYSAYPAQTPGGDNQREVDIVRAFAGVCRDIAADEEIPLALHSGDVGDRPQIPVRHMLAIRSEFQRIASPIPGEGKIASESGFRRQLVVIAGNHDLPRHAKEPCYLEMYAGIPGVHVVTRSYTVIDFGPEVEAGRAHPALRDVVVHALPHDELKRIEFDAVRPIPGKTNILMAHGVAGGSELYVRTIGREYAIPTDVLGRDWDYVALGHWHKQGPVGLLSNRDTGASKIHYAGSTENVSFRDLRDNGTKRGYLRVQIRPQEMPEVRARHLPIRQMLRLPVLDVAGMSPEEIVAALRERVRSAGGIDGAVVGQIVTGANRDVWSLIDLSTVREEARMTLHYEVTPKFEAPVRQEGDVPASSLGDLGSVLDERALVVLAPAEREAALTLARTLLGSALEAASPEAAEAAETAQAEPGTAPGLEAEGASEDAPGTLGAPPSGEAPAA